MSPELVARVRKLTQHYAYDSIKMHETIAQKAGLPGTDHKYLGFLLVEGQMTAGRLAELSGLTTGAVTGLIDRFEKKKLVKRQMDKDDRRKVLIVPNAPNIMALLQPLFTEFGEKSEAMIASFSDEEIAVVERFLSQSIEIMNETTQTFAKPTKKK